MRSGPYQEFLRSQGENLIGAIRLRMATLGLSDIHKHKKINSKGGFSAATPTQTHSRNMRIKERKILRLIIGIFTNPFHGEELRGLGVFFLFFCLVLFV